MTLSANSPSRARNDSSKSHTGTPVPKAKAYVRPADCHGQRYHIAARGHIKLGEHVLRGLTGANASSMR